MTELSCAKYERHFSLLLDEQLSGELRSELLDHVVSCPECRAHYDWLHKAQAELEAYGESIVVGAPEIDVTADVLRALHNVERPAAGEIVPFNRPAQASPTRRSLPFPWLSAAAAAMLVAVSLWFALPLLNSGEDPGSTVATNEPKQPGTPEETEPPSVMPVELEPVEPVESQSEIVPATEPELDATPEPPGARIQRSIDRGDVVAAFKDAVAFGDEERSRLGSERLAELARLNLEEAEALFAQENLSPEELAGIAPSLSPADRRVALLRAIGNSPDDPALRYKLLREYQADPASQAEALEQLVALDEMDDENAMVHYTEAQILLAQNPPDVQGALAALTTANGMEVVSSYAVDSAEAREAALIEGGADPLTAELVSALSAGYWEYNELTTVANDLLYSADSLMTQGDTERAVSIYEAVREMGSQLGNNAQFAQERLAGAEIEKEALDALSAIYGAQGAETEIERITAASYDLSETMSALVDHFERAENFLGIPVNDDTAVGQLAQSILSIGDIFTFAADVLGPIAP